MATDAIAITLVRQAARWHTAALQDENPLIRMLHANYAASTVDALRQVCSDREIRRATGGLDGRGLQAEVTAAQDDAVRRFAQLCPRAIPRGTLAQIAGER